MLLIRLFVVGLFGVFLVACEGAGPVEAKNGTVSLNGTLTQVASLESEADCPNGGVTLEHGIDLNGDGTLEEDEITHTYVICHGVDGQDANNDEVTAQLDALRVELDALKAVVQLNTAKVGVSQEQVDQIAENTTTLTDLGNHSAFDGWDKSVADDANYLTEETDPVASAAGYLLVETDPVASTAGYLTSFTETDPVASAAGYLTSFTETDPVASAAGYLTEETDPVASAAGYLTEETDPVASAAGYLTEETDPVASAAGYLTSETDPVASAAGYLTSFTETDPVANGIFAVLGSHVAFDGWDKDVTDDPTDVSGLTAEQAESIAHITVLDTRLEILARDNYSNYDATDFDWSMMRELNYLTSETDPVASAAGYLTSETDPVASAAGYLTSETDPVASAAGYLTSETDPIASAAGYLTSETDPVASAAGYLTSETDPVASAAGYLTSETDPVASAAGYLTSFIETDPVANAEGYLTADSDLLFMFGDYDNDSITNIDDNCAFDSNENQVDADRDGKGDQCDITTPSTIMSTDSSLMFTRCPVGIDFLDGFMFCRSWHEQEGGFSSSNFQFCSDSDNSCNDVLFPNGAGGALNSDGNSELHAACDDLELDGHTDWRVPNRAEMTVWASDILEKNYVGSNEWSDYKFWTSEASGDTTGYVYDKNAGAFYNEEKINNFQVYCVRDVTP